VFILHVAMICTGTLDYRVLENFHNIRMIKSCTLRWSTASETKSIKQEDRELDTKIAELHFFVEIS